MPEHSLEPGQKLIEGLSLLGGALGYEVVTEFPVERDKHNPQVIDVAWLLEKGQDFPLMIFEVESKVSNTIANNPLKIYAKPNQTFEKPLFFFHIMVTGGKETSRISDVVTEFGRHNYRTYRLEAGELNQLLKDVFSQHRRITRKIDLIDLTTVLETEYWEHADLNSLLVYIEDIGFERGTGALLPQYVRLSQNNTKYIESFVRYLHKREDAPSVVQEKDSYTTYIGQTWSIPIHLGILSYTAPLDKEKYIKRLKAWQEDTFFPTQIGPYFGLSRDYDEFIQGVSGSFWGLIALLMSDIPEAVEYISNQCRNVLEALKPAPPHISFFTALWLLHISSLTSITIDNYEYARSFINSRGGIHPDVLYDPPGVVLIAGSHDWLYSNWDSQIQVPSFDEFRKYEYNFEDIKHTPVSLAINTFFNELAFHMYGHEISALMSKNRHKAEPNNSFNRTRN